MRALGTLQCGNARQTSVSATCSIGKFQGTPDGPPVASSHTPRDRTNRRDLVLEAARAAFVDEGYQKASMRSIATRAGMTQAALYYHFSDKDAILMEILEEHALQMAQLLEAAYDECKDVRRRLRQVCAAHLDLLFEHPSSVQIVIEENRHLTEANKIRIRDLQRRVLQVYVKSITARQPAGADSHKIRVQAFSTIGALNWVYHWHAPTTPTDVNLLKEQIVDFVLKGVDG